MFQCNHCHTEYGGIRGVSGDKCPRCVDREAVANRRQPVSATIAMPTTWASPELAASSLSLPSAPYPAH